MTTATLRAWESRYELLTPARTAGGQRLYSEADVSRVRAVRRLVAEGWSVAGAASQVLGEPGRPEDAAGERPGDTGEVGSGDRFAASALLLPSSATQALLDTLAAVDSYAVLAAYETVRDLLQATSPAQVRDTLVNLVRRLGGEVGGAALQDDTVIPVDLAFGEGPPLLPRVPSPSVARMRLEALLPLVVEDARLLIHRLRLSAPTDTAGHAGGKMLK
jgi:DNA-binding transcriptional MerR regulator